MVDTHLDIYIQILMNIYKEEFQTERNFLFSIECNIVSLNPARTRPIDGRTCQLFAANNQ